MTGGKHAFGHTITAQDKKSIASSSQRDPLNDDSFEMEDWDDIMEKIQLDAAIEDKKRQVRKIKPDVDDSYKDNFLIQFLEK